MTNLWGLQQIQNGATKSYGMIRFPSQFNINKHFRERLIIIIINRISGSRVCVFRVVILTFYNNRLRRQNNWRRLRYNNIVFLSIGVFFFVVY